MELPAFLKRHTQLISDKDLDGLMAKYHPEAVVMRPGACVRGLDEIREFFAAYMKINPRVEEVHEAESTEDLVLYRATMVSDLGPREAVGTLALRDGLVWRQTVITWEKP